MFLVAFNFQNQNFPGVLFLECSSDLIEKKKKKMQFTSSKNVDKTITKNVLQLGWKQKLTQMLQVQKAVEKNHFTTTSCHHTGHLTTKRRPPRSPVCS